jgi:hypothetical protein
VRTAEKMQTRCSAKAFTAAVTLLAAGSVSAWSADFSKSPVPNSNAVLIAISGDLALGDERKFIDLALSSQKALVVFQSPGGNVFAAIEIGKAIHLKASPHWCPMAFNAPRHAPSRGSGGACG